MTPRSGAEPPPVFIGDVQGCGDELDQLIRRCEDALGADCRFGFVGDIVNRGPRSLYVLERVRALVEAGRARCVLGNHEINLLMVGYGLRTPGEHDTMDDVLDSADAGEWLDWLRRLPLVEVGQVGGSPYAMVHASVHPDWTLVELRAAAGRVEARLASEDADVARGLLALAVANAPPGSERDVLGRLTTCRSVRGDAWWSDPPGNGRVAWHQAWSARRHDYGIVYGHWSLQGLHVERGLRGLDTGCVHHGRGRDGHLTAWVPALESHGSRDAFDVPDERFWQVRGLRRYYAS